MLSVTDLQLYFAVGIPTLAVLVGILTNSMQFSSLNSRITSLESRFDARFERLEIKFETLTGKVIDIDNRVTRIEAKLNLG